MKIGSTPITDIKVGSTQITKVIRNGITYWEVDWTPQTLVVEDAQPTHIVMTGTVANTNAVASDFTITGFTVSSLSRDGTNKILTLTLSTSVSLGDVLNVVFKSKNYLVTNNVTKIYLILTSTGNGTGVSQLNMAVSENTIITLDGAARFYTDAGGTLGESTTWTCTFGATRTIYLKCPSGAANFIIEKNKVIRIPLWTSGVNAASISGDIGNLTNLTYVNMTGNMAISGDISRLTSLTSFVMSGNTTITGSITALTGLTNLEFSTSGIDANTISGSVAALTNLVRLIVLGNNTLTGSIAALTKLTRIDVRSYYMTLSGSIAALTLLNACILQGLHTVTGDISALTALTRLEVRGIDIGIPGDSSLSGSINGLTLLTILIVMGTGTTVSGDVSGLTSLGIIDVWGQNTLTYSNVTNLHALSYLDCWSNAELTSANVNQLLADFWANRDYAKPISSTRSINVRGGPTSGAPTGQGITDKAALQAYKSPNNTGPVVWSVYTR